MILTELTTTTLVAADPPKVTVAPALKPVPLIVTAEPPAMVPPVGETDVTVTGETPVTVTFADLASLQPADVVTVTLRVSVPAAPAVKVMLLVPAPAVIVPLPMVHAYVAPTPAFATDATLPVEPDGTLTGAVMVAFGLGLMVTFAVFVAEQLEALVTVSVRPTVPEAPAV